MRQPPPSNNSRFDRHLDGIKVRLLQAPGAEESARTIATFYESTWGDIGDPHSYIHDEAFHIAHMVMAGKGLPNCLETVNLTFAVEGLTRASTHQLVRTRIGAGFGQQNGSNTNWQEFNFRVPESWYTRADEETRMRALDLTHEMRELYEEMIDDGVPFQDARYLLPMGTQTTLIGTYNLLAVKGLAARRLCNRMFPETNQVVRQMVDLTVRALPWVGRNLRSVCEKSGRCVSVSPMFPPSCVTSPGEMCDDGAVLKSLLDWTGGTVEDRAVTKGEYDWTIEANGNHTNIGKDTIRLMAEADNPDLVLSVVDGRSVLANTGAL